MIESYDWWIGWLPCFDVQIVILIEKVWTRQTKEDAFQNLNWQYRHFCHLYRCLIYLMAGISLVLVRSGSLLKVFSHFSKVSLSWKNYLFVFISFWVSILSMAWRWNWKGTCVLMELVYLYVIFLLNYIASLLQLNNTFFFRRTINFYWSCSYEERGSNNTGELFVPNIILTSANLIINWWKMMLQEVLWDDPPIPEGEAECALFYSISSTQVIWIM